MFTDGPVTPLRLEMLIELLRQMSAEMVARQDLYQLMQPDGLPALNPNREQAKATVTAAIELNLLEECGRTLKLSFDPNQDASSRQIVLKALDCMVLETRDVEPYFASFYSYVLFLDREGARKKSGEEWARDYERDVLLGKRLTNPFNRTKYSGLKNWYAYVGLGWFDPNEVFQANPYERLRRKLSDIFGNQKRLNSFEFMKSMAGVCPELDGGKIFIETNRSYHPENLTCTLGLSQALIELHLLGILRLSCSQDSRGWSLESAEPPNDGKSLLSNKIDYIEKLAIRVMGGE